MVPPFRSSAKPEFDTATNNLWVGNLTPDVTEAELTALFEKYGQVDSITSYSARSYAFLYFRSLEDAKAAKDALQGTVLRGNPLKIEFAKPAKPCKSLWVAGIGQSVSKEELEEHFKKFGKILEFKFIKDRNTAYIDYARLEDATEALKTMNGKQISGEQIRVDYLRSHPARREQGPDFAREGQFPYRNTLHTQDYVTAYSEPTHAGSKRPHQFQSLGGRRDGQPSKILWISYPPSVHVEEDMLHNAMILFGEIERIKTFDDRNYAFVEFRSVEEAMLAKEGLQGKLFNDPRISIEFSSSGFAAGREYFPYQPSPMGILDHNRPLLPNNIPGHLPPHSIHGLDMLIRPQNRYDPGIPSSEYPDVAAIHKLQESSPHNLMGGSDWRRSSPVAGASPSGVLRPLNRPASGGWDVYDAASQLPRESKRSRVDGSLPRYDGSLPPNRLDDEQYSMGSVGALGTRKHRLTPAGVRGTPSHDYIWRGLIAKGGTPVCRARCVPIGEEIVSEIPDVVNCSARTGLDLLTKHYADAVGFKIVFFLPDSEEDFASYTEFLRYLGTKNRAGVAKFDDGTTLFLVPPSDFLTNVLNIAGPERLYGVVLEFQQTPNATSVQPPPMDSLQPPYADVPKMTSYQTAYNMPPDDRTLQMDYNKVLRDDIKLPPKAVGPPTSEAIPLHSVPPSNTLAPSQGGVTLTPELIATLSSLLPAKSSNSENTTVASTPAPVLNTTVAPDKGHPQGWRYEQQTPEQAGHLASQLGSHFNTQSQPIPPAQTHAPVFNVPNHSAHGVVGFNQIHEQHPFDLQTQAAASSKVLTSTTIPPQSGQIGVPPHVEQHNPVGMSQGLLRGPGLLASDASAMYGSAVLQQPTSHSVLPNQVNSQPHASTPQASGSGITGHPQQLQSTFYGVGQEGFESEENKNERYQATLRFAANLLSQIQQQQPSGQSGQGSGSH